MPSDARDSSPKKSCVLMAGVAEGLTMADVEQQLRLLRSLAGVHLAETWNGKAFSAGEMQAFVLPDTSRFDGYPFVLLVLMSRDALVGVLSSMLQMGCQGIVKIQQQGR